MIMLQMEYNHGPGSESSGYLEKEKVGKESGRTWSLIGP